jgi:beta-lactam-binding protein with PASTA domain
MFLINLVVAVVAVLLLSLFAFKMLDVYTMHGQVIPLADFIGKTLDELEQYSDEYGFDFTVNDSVFDPTRKPGSIVLQDPVPGSPVKKGRSIYLTLVSLLPENVQVPDLQNLSLRQAVSLLETYGLRSGRLIFVTDPLVEHGTLVKRQILNGDTLEAGTEVSKGSIIDLVVGKSTGSIEVPVPLLIGLTQAEAVYTLNKAALNVGFMHFMDDEDTEICRVYQQSPMYAGDSYLGMGSEVNIWLRSEKSFNFDQLRTSYKIIDTIQTDYFDETLIEIDSID